MIKQFYIQLDQEGYVKDCIEYPHEDYIPVQMDTPLPFNLMSGCYRVVGGTEILYVPEKDVNQEVENLKKELKVTQEALDFLMLSK